MSSTLYYVHDPMCSWCWAFRPTWDQVSTSLPDEIGLVRVLGGLAPDTDEEMPQAQQHMLQDIWRNIQARVPGTQFNFDFWTQCKPRRSTYPACRAVVAAVRQGEEHHELMTRAIQQAYYLDARNPSDEDTLIALAGDLKLDVAQFGEDLNSPYTQQEFKRQIEACHYLGVPGFPSLILQTDKFNRRLPVEFNNPGLQLELIQDAAGFSS